MSFAFMVAEDEKKMNATYIISVARKLGCTVFLLPEDIMEVTRECRISSMHKFDKNDIKN
jgi:hypothetical protein